jgi:regulator of protease activity HflC (stomatin/prohibitin superfamily)
MFDKLLEWLLSIINQLLPWFIIREYEEAIVLRLGKLKGHYKKGFYWKVPFADEVIEQHVVTTTLNLPSQSLVTKDGTNIVVKAMVKYKITDVQTFLLEVYDSIDAISDVAQGIVKDIVMSSTWDQCRDLEIDNTITKKVRVELKKLGVYIEKVTLTDIANIKTLRLINESTFNG